MGTPGLKSWQEGVANGASSNAVSAMKVSDGPDAYDRRTVEAVSLAEKVPQN
jgi:hypothetical protein